MMKSAREPNEKRTPFLQHFFDSKTDEEIFFGYFGKRLLEIIDNYSVENGRYSSNVFTKEELVDILLVELPDANNISAVAVSEFTELSGRPSSFFEHNGKKYSRKHIYGLYSSKGEFMLPVEYDEIKNLCDNIWACLKDGVITIIETEKGD